MRACARSPRRWNGRWRHPSPGHVCLPSIPWRQPCPLSCLILGRAKTPSRVTLQIPYAFLSRVCHASGVALEGQYRIGSAKTETVRNRHVDLCIVDPARDDIGVAHGGIELFDIRALADEAVAHHQERVDGLVHASRTLAVAGQRLGGA